VRLFVAAYPPREALDDLAALVERLAIGQPAEPGRSRRLAPHEQWHVTLAFLGEVPDGKADKAADAVRRVAGGDTTAPAVRIAGGGRFGRGRFTIMWAAMGGDVAGLTALASTVRRELRSARLPFDRKPFRPHLTLARPGDRVTTGELAADLAALKAYEGPLWTVDAVRLVRSTLGPQPHYDPIVEVGLRQRLR
jgi:2'-5' RNA ligase